MAIGNLYDANLSAASASLRATPDTSNMIFPGLTTAAQYSLAALPPPIRTSAGFLETLTYKADGHPVPEWAIRAKKAHYNSIENLIVFAILIITAHLVEVSNDATISASIAYFWLRLAHYPLYVFNVPFGRTLAFAGSWFAQICIGYQVLFTKLV